MMRNRILKYLLIGIISFIAIRYIPSHSLLDLDIVVVAIIISIGYAILDKLMPSYNVT
jgi:hypothetical protein